MTDVWDELRAAKLEEQRRDRQELHREELYVAALHRQIDALDAEVFRQRSALLKSKITEDAAIAEVRAGNDILNALTELQNSRRILRTCGTVSLSYKR